MHLFIEQGVIVCFFYIHTLPLHYDNINNYTTTDSRGITEGKHRTNPKKLKKGQGKQKRRKMCTGREDESRELPLNSRYVGKGETFISLICIVSNACVVESRNEQD